MAIIEKAKKKLYNAEVLASQMFIFGKLLPDQEFLGISYEIKTHPDEVQIPHLVISIEAEARMDDVKTFIDAYGTWIQEQLLQALPPEINPSKRLGEKKNAARDLEILRLKHTEGMRYAGILKEIHKQGYPEVTEDIIGQVIKKDKKLKLK
jgi:hypothetical protein